MTLFAGLLSANPAFAITVSDVAESIVTTSSNVPGLISGISYALGLLFGVLGILKFKEHVENPGNGSGQTPIRTPIIRFIIGGALFALPTIYAAMVVAINGGEMTDFDPSQFTFAEFISGALGTISGLFGIGMPDINGILATIIEGLENVPGLISGISYALALVLGVAGLLKLKEHVESPDQTPLREGVIRLLIGGALFALPNVFEAMTTLITGGDGVGAWGQIVSVFSGLSWLTSPYAGGIIFGGFCNPIGTSMGSAVCSAIAHTAAAPAFLSSLSYLFGLILGVWGLLKIRDHVLNPSQTQVWEGFSRLLAGGAFFALPFVVEAVRSTVTPESLSGMGMIGGLFGFGTITGYNEGDLSVCGGLFGGGGDPAGLDVMMACMMKDMIGPIHSMLNFFSFTAGIVLIMIGISRLVKSAQDGARGPGGIGTFMTFLAGGSLISYNEFIRGFTTSFFNNPLTLTHATMQYTDGMSAGDAEHAHTVISAILKFMIVVGLISFVRGIFIVRNVAEGNGQASLMAGVTHMVGGALAVNLGPLLNAVQTTLGLTEYGIMFG
ncbi:MAG: hypothetical protein KDJ35_09055 [Alphaproteobacteria bacterium]|nr:hypothetical protein [Alphaproteobacteria bacterium]